VATFAAQNRSYLCIPVCMKAIPKKPALFPTFSAKQR
jgi:hypothetical protein